jgi:hypothetical protein
MPPPAISWHTLYPTMPASAWVAEAPETWHHPIPEKLVWCLWFDQRWRPSALRTLDGREVMVHSPGRWNLHAGPDFQQASIAFVDGARHRGDVEIHGCIGKKGATYAARFRDVMNDWGVSRFWASTDRGVAA